MTPSRDGRDRPAGRAIGAAISGILAIALSAAASAGSAAPESVSTLLAAGPASPAPGQRADTVVVQATPPVHAAGGILVEELAIGAVDGPETHTFGQVTSIAVAVDGTMYVADEIGAVVRLYDSTGKYLRSIGRKGQGPGEFGGDRPGFGGQAAGPRGVALMSDGKLLVYVYVGRRVLLYDPRGEPLLTRTERNLFGFHTLMMRPPYVLAGAGDIIHVRYELPVPGWVPRPLQFAPPGYYARWRPDGTPIDTILEPGWPVDPPMVYDGPRERSRRRMQVPFTPDFVWNLSPKGYFVTGMPTDRGGRYAVELRVPRAAAPGAGVPRWAQTDPVTSLRVPYTPITVGRQERRDYRSAVTAHVSYFNPTWRWNGPDIPDTKPPYKGVWVDAEGRLWVQVHTAAVEDPSAPRDARDRTGEVITSWPRRRWREPQVFDILEPSGRYVGQVRSDDRGMLFPQFARGDRLWAIVDSGDGLITIKRYRIVWRR